MTESLWNKYDISRKSPEVQVKGSPKVVMKETALALNAPRNSTAMSWKIYESVSRVYFASLITTGINSPNFRNYFADLRNLCGYNNASNMLCVTEVNVCLAIFRMVHDRWTFAKRDVTSRHREWPTVTFRSSSSRTVRSMQWSSTICQSHSTVQRWSITSQCVGQWSIIIDASNMHACAKTNCMNHL